MDLMNPSDLLIRFRQMLPFQQTVVAGLILFVIYELYASLVAGLKPLEAARESMYNTIIFMVVLLLCHHRHHEKEHAGRNAG